MKNVQQRAAIIAGVSLLLMAIAAGFSYGYVHNSLVITGDAGATFKNIQASLSLFELGILGWMIIIILDVLVSWAFYVVLKPVHKAYSLVAIWLRLLYTAILALAVSHLVIARQTILEGAQIPPSQVMTSILSFESIWSIGLIIFGLHLFFVGFVALKSSRIPKIISYLLVIAGSSYMLIHLLHTFFPQLEHTTNMLEMVLSLPMIAGELGFGIWLMVKGRKVTMTD
ncbi:DUF4386 domain-containing protein [Pseudalkalibacillus berkeleyi]|uniref:DUF4386 domain-containing protein n=1 Tax=Pseudalkalibacillus berkeleyi TaxID=1069813 RepID=A0ABS9H531_9BACL|nr:DUF4386 domain-containing protein [Pseudalkalibacillus berkeleyi]MCF6139181.1 DUF4386 domain-containing protein [Pseudalkalibacillus berkeleyi]